ncbi:hypothetical protein ACLKA6_000016 [Drosophila palustris]
MTKSKLILLLLLFHLLTPKVVIPAAAATEVSGMSQFLETRTKQIEDSENWTHLLPSNFYSALNQQYYVRFRRQSMLDLKDLRRIRPHPFEYAIYI